jgi:hypothetical protein
MSERELTSDLVIRINHKMQYPIQTSHLPDCPSVALEEAFEIVSEMIAKPIGLTLRNPPPSRDQRARNFSIVLGLAIKYT